MNILRLKEILREKDISGSNLIAVLSGTNLPSPVTSTTGEMLVVFVSDYSVSFGGFTANYSGHSPIFRTGLA
jgi:hypothetical protein